MVSSARLDGAVDAHLLFEGDWGRGFLEGKKINILIVEESNQRE